MVAREDVRAEGAEFARHAFGPAAPSLRRRLLNIAVRIAPRLSGRLLALRYLGSDSHVDPARIARLGEARLVPLGRDMAVLRHPAKSESGPRVLLVPGHDGHVRQFARLVRELRRAGAAVDLLVLPGHLYRARSLCSLADIVPAIRRCIADCGPYDAVGAHCVGGRSLLFALEEGLDCPRVAFISIPVDLTRLMRLGGTQYGLRGRGLASFEREVTRRCGPYAPDAPWRPAAERRRGATLVVHARHDFAAPVADACAFAAAVPGAELAVFEQGDHNAILNVAAAVRQVAEFLTAR